MARVLSKHEAIRLYVQAGFTLIPLDGFDPKTGKNNPKIPAIKNWQNAKFEIYEPEDFANKNVGVKLDDDHVIVDLDPRNFGDKPKGYSPWRELLAECNLPGLEGHTFTVITGGGGAHIYFKKPKDFAVVGELARYPGMEFKTKGQQVVACGSVHESGGYYDARCNDPTKIIEMPQILLAKIARKVRVINEDVKAKRDDSLENIKRYVDYLEQIAEPAIEGKSGDKMTYMVACFGRDLGLSAKVVLDAMLDKYNPRCVPPWKTEELQTKVMNAYDYAKDKQGVKNAANDFEVIRVNEEPAFKLQRQVNGEIKKLVKNVEEFFKNPLSPLSGSLAYNEFTNKVMIIKAMPWHTGEPPQQGWDWTDNDEILCKGWLSRLEVFGTDFNTSLIHEAVVNVAHTNPVHPVRDYLDSLKWDGVPRLDTWLIDYAGATDNIYHRAVAGKTLLGAVARIYEPGVKFDYVTVLEGDQGSGKSTLVEVLGGAWYGDFALAPDKAADTVAAMKGHWIIEASEMEFATRTEANAMKAFLTRKVDTVRFSYDRHTGSTPRKSIFIGTINPEADGQYLKDQTGNRRFLPVRTRAIDIPGLRKVRDQLFAEAKFRYEANETLYFDSKLVREAAVVEQQARQVGDPWIERLGPWLESDDTGKPVDLITSIEIFTRCLGGSDYGLTRRDTVRISNCMKSLGWEHGLFYDDRVGNTRRCYRRTSKNAKKPVKLEDLY